MGSGVYRGASFTRWGQRVEPTVSGVLRGSAGRGDLFGDPLGIPQEHRVVAREAVDEDRNPGGGRGARVEQLVWPEARTGHDRAQHLPHCRFAPIEGCWGDSIKSQ